MAIQMYVATFRDRGGAQIHSWAPFSAESLEHADTIAESAVRRARGPSGVGTTLAAARGWTVELAPSRQSPDRGTVSGC